MRFCDLRYVQTVKVHAVDMEKTNGKVNVSVKI